MKKSLLLFAIVAISFILASCNSDKSNVEYLPFLSENGGKWGLISTKGEILFKDEFENEPTISINGRFLVKDRNDKWTIYTAEAKPKKIGKEYTHAGAFIEDIAPVVESNKAVEFIDLDGNVKFTLDKVDGRTVTSVYNFSEGVARFKCNDDIGCINKNGDIIIKPEYCAMTECSDGKIIAIEKKYKDFEKKNKRDKIVVSVLDKEGNKLFTFNLNRFDGFTGSFTDGIMAVQDINDNNKPECGIIDSKGNWLTKPTKVIASIDQIQGENFVFSDGDSYGIKNIKGENIMKPKYDYLFFASKDLLYAGKIEGKDVSFKLIDLAGNEISKTKYEYALPFYDGEHSAVKTSKHSWTFIDKSGKELEKMPDIFRIDYNVGDYNIESDYVDLDALVEDLKITKDGMDVVSLGTLPKSMLVKADAYNDTTLYNPILKWTKYLNKPQNYYGLTDIFYYKKIDNIVCRVEASWNSGNGGIITEITGYHSYDFWDYTYNVPYTVGYRFVSYGPGSIFLDLIDSKIETKTQQLFDKLFAKFSKLGKLVKRNENAAVFNVNGKPYLIYKYPTQYVRIGRGTRSDLKNIDISYSSAKKIKEEEQNRKKKEKFEQQRRDSLLADTTIIDRTPFLEFKRK
jgi:hypothetical protein